MKKPVKSHYPSALQADYEEDLKRWRQTAIPAPPNRHNYRKGLDATLKAQQLQEILARNPNVKVYPRAKSGTPEPVPMFPEPKTQTELF